LRNWITLVLAGLLLGLGSSAVSAAPGLPYVEPANCPIEVPAEAEIECGVLVAPENYDQPEGRLVRMPYIILEAKNPAADRTPLLFTEGGPGGNSLPAVWAFANSLLVQDRDVIIFQQRGNLYAEPALACNADDFYDEQTETSPCLEKVQATGVDLSQFTSVMLAEDIESLRLSLGIEQWNLFGTSYSTRLMQILMDRHPEGIRSVILQSVVPLDETRFAHDPENSYRALHVMFEDCAADPYCAAAYPDLEQRFFDLVADLNRDPIELEFSNPGDGPTDPLEVNGDTLIGWIVSDALYDPAFPPFKAASYPLLIDEVASGNLEWLAQWEEMQSDGQLFSPDFIAFGLYLAVNCQDNAPRVTREQIESTINAFPQMDGYARHLGEWNLCQLWDLPAAPPMIDGPLSSEIPTLVLAGSYDPVTPPAWSRKVADQLEHSFYVEFPSKGHSLDKGSTCPDEIKRAFLLDPATEPDTTCLADEPKAKFYLPDEVMPSKNLITSTQDINFGVSEGNTLYEILFGGTLVLFLVEAAAFVVLSFKVRYPQADRREVRAKLAYLPHSLAALTAVLTWIVMLLMIQVGNHDLRNDRPFLPLSPRVLWLGAAVLAQMLCGASLIVLTVRTWQRRQSTRYNRIVLTLFSLAAVITWVFFFRWDLVDIVFIRLGL